MSAVFCSVSFSRVTRRFITYRWTSCTGASARSANTTVAFAEEGGGSRISDCYFDNADVTISGYRGTTITGSYFNGGASIVLAPPLKVEKIDNQTVAVPLCTDAKPCKVQASDPQCQYWRGAVCGLTLTSNRFSCGATCKHPEVCPSQCATIVTKGYAIPAASDIHLGSNSFEGKSPDVSVCTRGGRTSCAGLSGCAQLFAPCTESAGSKSDADETATDGAAPLQVWSVG